MKAIYRKSSFWRRLPGFHPAIKGTAIRTAAKSRHNGAHLPREARTTSRALWFDAFRDHRDDIRNVLEIGAFEGRTTTFLGWLFPHAIITCIDPWQDYCEVPEGMTAVGERFAQNTTHLSNRLVTIKGRSDTELPRLLENGERFDLIFIDGSHHYADVMLDSLYAWRLLDPGGVLVWDDYLWRHKPYGKCVPKLAIDQFLTGFRGSYKPLWAFKQIAVQKMA